MAVNVAISGFGRIGRLVLRSIIESKRKDCLLYTSDAADD